MAKPEIRLKGFEGEWEKSFSRNTFQFWQENSLNTDKQNGRS